MERPRDGEAKVGSNGKHHANGSAPCCETLASPSLSSSSSSSSSPSAEVPPGGRDLQDANGQPVEKVKPKRNRRAWAPDKEDQWVYELVKFDGMTQWEAADRARVSQATVSRIVERYERWKAHAEPHEDGELTPAERMRAQRWLTYQRNERILGKALRLATQMEECRESLKIVKNWPGDRDQMAQRTESVIVERAGIASRFLRLAHKINMEQHELTKEEAPPPPEPLTEEEVAEQEALAAADRADIKKRNDADAAVNQAHYDAYWEKFRRDAEAAVKQAREQAESALRQLEAVRREAEELRQALEEGETERRSDGETERLGDKEPAGEAPAEPIADELELKVHNLHNCIMSPAGASAEPACGCDDDCDPEKDTEQACIGNPGGAPAKTPERRPRVFYGGMPPDWEA